MTMRVRSMTLLLLLPLLSACAVGDTGARDETPPPQGRPTRTVTTTTSPLPLPTIEGKPVRFRTSDGNYGCDLEPAYVLCNVVKRTFTPPKKPSDCFYTWGKAVEMAIGSKGSFFCGHGEDYSNSKRVLKRGQALQVGLVTCRALPDGVLCSGQGHGFRLQRASYQLF
jgi:hypothetical protein